jgi:type III restriction enzyme
VFAIDTTGGHLLKEKTGRKLLSIEPPKARARNLVVRFVSAGQCNADVEQKDSAGYTVWGRKQDNTLPATDVDSVNAAVKARGGERFCIGAPL